MPVVVGTARAVVERPEVAMPRGVARDGAATGATTFLSFGSEISVSGSAISSSENAMISSYEIGATSANAGSVSNPASTAIKRFMIYLPF